MKRLFNFLAVALLASGTAFAQLPAGSTAPDFTITDIDGTTHNLYDILDQGTPVVLDLFAVWCGPCWSYAESGIMEDVNALYGPEGTNEVFMMAVEADASTPESALMGGGNSIGDWTTLIDYTLADDPEGAIADGYALAYYPTIYLICPDRTVTEIGQLSSTDAYYAEISACPIIVEGLNASVSSYDGELVACGGGKIEPVVTIQNVGTSTFTACTINTLVGGQVVSSYEWTGSLDTYGTEQVTLAELSAGITDVTFEVVLAGDLNTDDDNLSVTLSSAIEAHASIQVELMTDGYPEEVNWTITDANGSVVANGGGFTGATTSYTQELSLAEGCYTFEITDDYGDGLYGWGQVEDGFIELVDGDGTQIFFATGDYGDAASGGFEVTHGVGIDEVLANELTIFPNPTSNDANIALNLVEANEVSIEIVNTLGQKVFASVANYAAGATTIALPVENFTTGLYYVNIRIANELTTEKLNIIK